MFGTESSSLRSKSAKPPDEIIFVSETAANSSPSPTWTRTPRRSKDRPEEFLSSSHSFALAAPALTAGEPIQAISFKTISRVGAPDAFHEQGASGAPAAPFDSEVFASGARAFSSRGDACGDLSFVVFSPDNDLLSSAEAKDEIFSGDEPDNLVFPAPFVIPGVGATARDASPSGISTTLPVSFGPENSSPSVCHAIAATPWFEGRAAEKMVNAVKKFGANALRATPPRNNPRAPSPKTKFRGNRKREPALPGSPNSDRSSSRWSME